MPRCWRKKDEEKRGWKLLKLADGLTESTTKKAEALDMLEKGQIRVRTDFSFEEKALASVSQLTGFVARASLIIALFIGSCLLCTAASIAGSGVLFIVFLVMGLVGYGISVLFAWRLYRNLKKKKKKG